MPSALRSRRTLAGLGAGLGLLVACVAWFVPFLTRERGNVAGVPVPPPFITQAPVHIDPGSKVCLSAVAFDTDADLVELTTLTASRRRTRMQIVAEAPGYRQSATVPRPHAALTPFYAQIDPPEQSVLGALCVRNRGKRRTDLLGTTDARTAVGRPVTRIDGSEVTADVTVRLVSTEPGSVLERLGQLADRAAAFKPGLFGATGFLWVALLLAAIAAPAAAVYALLSSFRDVD